MNLYVFVYMFWCVCVCVCVCVYVCPSWRRASCGSIWTAPASGVGAWRRWEPRATAPARWASRDVPSTMATGTRWRWSLTATSPAWRWTTATWSAAVGAPRFQPLGPDGAIFFGAQVCACVRVCACVHVLLCVLVCFLECKYIFLSIWRQFPFRGPDFNDLFICIL